MTCVVFAVFLTGLLPARGQDPGIRPNLDLIDRAEIGSNSPGADASQPTVRLAKVDGGQGDVVRLSVTVHVPLGSYTYSLNPSFGAATKIDLAEVKGLTPVSKEFRPDREPKSEFEPLFNQTLEKYLRDVTWTRDYRVDPSAAAGGVSVKGTVIYQLCDENTCVPHRSPFEVSLAAASDSVPASPDVPIESHPYTFEETPPVRNEPGPATIRAELSPANAQPRDEVTLAVTMTLKDGWHTYSITQAPGQAAMPTALSVTDLSGLQPIDDEFTPEPAPEPKQFQAGETTYRQEVHHGTVTWSQRFRVLDSAADSGYGLAARIKYQTCTGQQCLLPKTVRFALGSVAGGEVPSPGGNEPASSDSAEGGTAVAEADAGQNLGLVPFLIAAIVAGFAALATPCVFPMVPITVSFFLKQSEQKHHRPIPMALAYCGGIIGTFTVIGILMAVLFGAAELNDLANDPWLNLFIAGVLIFFGLNLLGLFEIRVPSWLLTWSSGKESRGGYIGVLFMALTFTLVSFTCTFAFVGGLLVMATRGQYYFPVLGLLAFSAAFALPFFFLALFPSMLQKLPESGGWMNSVKVTMGLIECGAAFKFLSVADLAWYPVPMFFDYALVMSAWMVIAVCTGLYLLGLFRLPHDTPSESISVLRFVFAMSFLGFAGYLAVGLYAPQKPTGVAWEKIAAFAPPNFEGGRADDLGPYLEHDGLKYALDYERALEVARKNNQPVFLDFTGVNCVNCREMEGRMKKPQLRERLAKFVRIQLYADNVPTITDPAAAERILEKNRALQEDWFGDVTLPSYAVITPDRQVLAKLKGQHDEETFAGFLDRGLEGWNRHQSRATASRKTSQRPANGGRR